MATDSKHPHKGDLAVDASELSVKNLTREQAKNMVRLRAGGLSALELVIQLKPEHLAAAGISPGEVTRATALRADYKYADELLGPAEKLAELVLDTKLDRGNQIANLLTEIANQVRHRVERDLLNPEVQAALQELLDYQYGPAYKGQLTKARKAKAEGEPPGKTPQPPGKGPETPPSKAPAPEPPATKAPLWESPVTAPVPPAA